MTTVLRRWLVRLVVAAFFLTVAYVLARALLVGRNSTTTYVWALLLATVLGGAAVDWWHARRAAQHPARLYGVGHRYRAMPGSPGEMPDIPGSDRMTRVVEHDPDCDVSGCVFASLSRQQQEDTP